MNKLKVLSLLLVFSLLFGFSAFSANETPSDVPDDSIYAEAIYVVNALGIITTYPDGLF